MAVRLNYKYKDLYDMSPREVDLLHKAHYKYESEFYQFLGNELRKVAYIVAKFSFGGSKAQDPKQLYKFPWELQEENEKQRRFIENGGVLFDSEDKTILAKYFNWNLDDQTN